MEQKQFEETIEEQLKKSAVLLFSKNAAYNPNDDKLRGFKVAAELGRVTPQKALSGMMAKHTVSVYDMCDSDRTFPMDVWDEKITDHINYLLLLRAIVEEQFTPSEEALALLREKLTTKDIPLAG